MTQLIEMIQGMGVPFSTAIVIVAIISFAMLVFVVAAMIEAFVRHRQDLQFKRDMLERGLSIEEIERLIGAPTPKPEQVE